jgi:hypothetical protein
MANWEIEHEKAVALRVESQKVQEASPIEERVRWIEDEVEELERWDGME